MSMELSDRVRQRIKDEMSRQHLSQRDVAGLLTWSQSRVAKVLTGRVEMGVDDLGALCFALNLHPTEAVRDHGLEFLAEMSPTELRILERIRQLPKPIFDAVMTLLDVYKTTAPQERRALAPKRTGGLARR
jgi:transcriptional regulator with XRE-family HTH domain